jgi:phosphoenolpyruvate---glycerone phosphotransferase subunit DhaL
MRGRCSVSPNDPGPERRAAWAVDTPAAPAHRSAVTRSDRPISASAGLDRAFVVRWIEAAASSIHEQRDHLTQLDAAIGDADHGINLDRGFEAGLARVRDSDALPPGRLLQLVGETLILSVGGAAGPLYGSCLREVGRSLGEDEAFDAEALLVALRAGLQEIVRLGAAAEGDKTIVDAYAPALSAMERGLRAGRGAAAFTNAREAAEAGMRATIPLVAHRGRASYLGPRSAGHQDPGATSTALLFGALEAAVRPAAERSA